ncbi:ataxin-3 [Eurytemora carolleeae]|uniref:ataxin-3 n=1 Tax=Eurytemora carolleeae TaxID=1294199 RepID=UPI000C77D63C|nr:ataxin-3 [Eurytemora carolleeae]|eukprot:XP_023333294.1 ataxin-3-like [Eurytemora affinis]
MAAEGDSAEYRRFMQQPSSNMDDSGFFSVQVISKALEVWGLELVSFTSADPLAERARQSPLAAQAYICNYQEHWFTIRRLGQQWFNLNSLLEFPELVSNTYLGEFLAQLQQEGYSIFIIKGQLPECDADLVLQAVQAVQARRPNLLSDVRSSGSKGQRIQQGTVTKASGASTGSARDEEADLEAAMMLSLAENVPGPSGGPAVIDEDELQMALAMSQGDESSVLQIFLF